MDDLSDLDCSKLIGFASAMPFDDDLWSAALAKALLEGTLWAAIESQKTHHPELADDPRVPGYVLSALIVAAGKLSEISELEELFDILVATEMRHRKRNPIPQPGALS